ncbi:MAG: dUTPase [archaeon]|nr:dUTPase [archaeon]
MENNNSDKLDLIFEKQKILQNRFGVFEKIKDQSFKQKYVNLMILSCLDELSESLRETAWKNPDFIEFGWKKNSQFNDEKFKEELVDLAHFFVNLCLASGMNSEEFFNRYINKNKENHARQDRNY